MFDGRGTNGLNLLVGVLLAQLHHFLLELLTELALDVVDQLCLPGLLLYVVNLLLVVSELGQLEK